MIKYFMKEIASYASDTAFEIGKFDTDKTLRVECADYLADVVAVQIDKFLVSVRFDKGIIYECELPYLNYITEEQYTQWVKQGEEFAGRCNDMYNRLCIQLKSHKNETI